MAYILKYEVNIVEYERRCGQRIYETKEFDSYDEAVAFIEKFNSENDVPDFSNWYKYATLKNFSI